MSLGKVYLASGWFSPEWLEEVENIKEIFDLEQSLQHQADIDFHLLVKSILPDIHQISA